MAMIFWILVALWLIAQLTGSFKLFFRKEARSVRGSNGVKVEKTRARRQHGDPLKDEGQYVDFEEID
jgi:hypothetical protein